MYVQATALGSRMSRTTLNRVSGLSRNEARIFKARDNAVRKIVEMDDAIALILIGLSLAIEVTKSGKPRVSSETKSTAAMEAVNKARQPNSGRVFRGQGKWLLSQCDKRTESGKELTNG